jgi:hypothetical protein
MTPPGEFRGIPHRNKSGSGHRQIWQGIAGSSVSTQSIFFVPGAALTGAGARDNMRT